MKNKEPKYPEEFRFDEPENGPRLSYNLMEAPYSPHAEDDYDDCIFDDEQRWLDAFLPPNQ